jgi:hypothetical protein
VIFFAKKRIENVTLETFTIESFRIQVGFEKLCGHNSQLCVPTVPNVSFFPLRGG